MAFRYRVGVDTLNYIDLFSRIPLLSEIEASDFFSAYEPLYFLICASAKSIYNDFTTVQIIHVVLINILITRFIFKNTDYILTALFFYLLFFSLYFNTEIIRESIAVTIFINAYQFIKDKKYIPYYLCIILAMGFHTSASICLLIPLVRSLKFNLLFLFIAIAFTLSVNAFHEVTLGYIETYMPGLAADKVGRYMNFGILSLKQVCVTVLNYMLFPALLLIILKCRKIEFRYENLICLGILAGLGTMFFTIIFSRFANYFVLFNIILMTQVIAETRFHRISVVSLGLVFCYSVFIMKINYFTDPGLSIPAQKYLIWYPYHSVFDKTIEPRRELFRNEYH